MDSRPTIGALLKLSECRLELAGPEQDMRGRTLLDASGERAGRVRNVFIDGQGRVGFMEITAGGALGFRKARLLVPVELVTRVTKDAVQVNESRERLRRAPSFRRSMTAEPYLEDVYSYYGCRSRTPELRVYPGSGYSR
jgi:hypothetical protein